MNVALRDRDSPGLRSEVNLSVGDDLDEYEIIGGAVSASGGVCRPRFGSPEKQLMRVWS